MPNDTAEDLPFGSVIATDATAWIKNVEHAPDSWSSTTGETTSSEYIELLLGVGCPVLRRGTSGVAP